MQARVLDIKTIRKVSEEARVELGDKDTVGQSSNKNTQKPIVKPKVIKVDSNNNDEDTSTILEHDCTDLTKLIQLSKSGSSLPETNNEVLNDMQNAIKDLEKWQEKRKKTQERNSHFRLNTEEALILSSRTETDEVAENLSLQLKELQKHREQLEIQSARSQQNDNRDEVITAYIPRKTSRINWQKSNRRTLNKDELNQLRNESEADVSENIAKLRKEVANLKVGEIQSQHAFDAISSVSQHPEILKSNKTAAESESLVEKLNSFNSELDRLLEQL